ncbi:hypothetical protein M8C21_000353, partial [Ambrosia artemisiifolia]
FKRVDNVYTDRATGLGWLLKMEKKKEIKMKMQKYPLLQPKGMWLHPMPESLVREDDVTANLSGIPT